MEVDSMTKKDYDHGRMDSSKDSSKGVGDKAVEIFTGNPGYKADKATDKDDYVKGWNDEKESRKR